MTTLADAFTALYGNAPEACFAAPGRVNLIGEHTDYNEGFVLPFAIDKVAGIGLRIRPRESGRLLRIASTRGGQVVEAQANGLVPSMVAPWARYVAGVFWAMEQRGFALPGADILLDSTVPVGAGLSSSAAIECAVALGLNEHLGLGLSREELVLICQLAENEFVGAPTGILDQSASLLSTPDHALFLDCRTRDARQVDLPLAASGLQVLVIDTRVSHSHDSGGYRELVLACTRGARELGVAALRDVGTERLDEARETLAPEIYRRVKHIVTENQRVLDTVELLESRGPAAIGGLLLASHASMRDDFGISCVELDLAVDTSMAAGAIGARMTGGGFGGSAIALIEASHAEGVSAAVRRAFAEAGYITPEIFSVVPGPGARRL
ncbi:galactokinase [Paeniglutamicibacter sp. ABSL32-1]|uniref:galactokinase n=1 Tax=Paeniglutamicibacter quisquiliarum TaxID=2849498 RepID=UPI001C2D91F5|nr:galactokinase [Paeniglutamicibacter quisquiliarum]MBV1778084.1 galactokinase [Paeniglutamicibacter quisquiliarum]